MNTYGDQLLSYFQVISLDDIPHALSSILHSTTIPHHEPFCKHDACSECLQSVQAQLRRVKTAKQKQRLHTLGTKSTALPLSSASICSALHCCRLTSTLTVEPITIALHTVYQQTCYSCQKAQMRREHTSLRGAVELFHLLLFFLFSINFLTSENFYTINPSALVGKMQTAKSERTETSTHKSMLYLKSQSILSPADNTGISRSPQKNSRCFC